MKRRLLIPLFFLLALSVAKAQEGISFESGTWADVLSKAKSEQKLVFVDFYTQWCGPCHHMATKIFSLYSVGAFYNAHFINVKIDAESPEGAPLARKYNVKAYPWYVFVNPSDETQLHCSSGRQDAETFLFTGASALRPDRRSTYLVSQRALEHQDPTVLIHDALYRGSIHDADGVLQTLALLSEIPGYNMENEQVWDVFVKYVKGYDNEFFHEVASHIQAYRARYGAKAVDGKLYGETLYCRDSVLFAALPHFFGKEVLAVRHALDKALQEHDYKKASVLADTLMSYRGPLSQDVCDYLYFVSRSNLYGDYPCLWHDKCLEISRFVAYNHPERDNQSLYYHYSVELEMRLKRLGYAPADPVYGTKSYTLRPRGLKPKPAKASATPPPSR